MHFYKYDIVFQEIPNEISLAFYICGCPIRCKGCHSAELWDEQNGTVLSEKLYRDLLLKYSSRATCVLFMGGEWESPTLISFLRIAREYAFKTALYTGLDSVPEKIKSHLDYLKVGPWMSDRGGLNSPHTNQILWDVKNNLKLNKLFLNQYE